MVHQRLALAVVLITQSLTMSSVDVCPVPVAAPGIIVAYLNSNVELIWTFSEDVDNDQFGSYHFSKGDIKIFNKSVSGIISIHSNFTNRLTASVSGKKAHLNMTISLIYDADDYCFQQIGNCPMSMCNATIVILGVPEEIKIDGKQSVNEHDNLTLTCSAVSRTRPEGYAPVMIYMWNINGTNITDGSTGLPERHSLRNREGQVNKQLAIRAIERGDIYQYSCYARENGSELISAMTSHYLLLPNYIPDAATFTPSGNKTVNANGTFTLSCSSDDPGRPPGHWMWTRPNRPEVNTSNVSQLTITEATVMRDDGEYSCRLNNHVGDGVRGYVTVTVQEMPFLEVIQNVSLTNTESLNVSCVAKARPEAVIVWKYDNGSSLPSSVFNWTSLQQQEGKYTMTMSYLTWAGGNFDGRRHKGGIIYCNATNVVDSASAYFFFDIHFAPYAVQVNPSPSAKIVEYKSLGPVLCAAICNPPCSYSWSKGGRQVSSNATLTIHNVTRDDHGMYECQPDNRISGFNMAEFNLVVFYGPAVDTFTIGSPNDPIIEGDSVRFTCQIDSRPIPVITMFTPRGDELASSSHNQSLEHTRPDIDCLDSGQYKCQAFNSETGKYHNRMTTATVHCAPRKNRTSAREVAATDGDTVSFNITTVAYPQPAFTWLFNGTELYDLSYSVNTHNRDVWEPGVFASSSLTLSNITQEIFGNYSVMANNSRGTMDDVVFLLTAVGVPVGPQNYRVHHANAVSITMHWTSGWNRGGEQVFTLMYRRSDSDHSYTRNTDISDPGQGVTVTSRAVGLLPGTSYDLMVQATNLHGASQWQLVTHLTAVEPNLGSDSDDSFTIVIIGRMATITWSLHSYSGPITHVDVNSCVSDSMNCILTTNVSSKASTVEVAVPKGGSSYMFEFLVYDGEDLLSTVSHRAGVDGGSQVGIIVGVVVGVMVVIAIAVGGFIYWKRRSQTDVRKDKTNASELGHVNPVMVTDDDISPTANGKRDTMSEGHQMVVENTLYASSGPGRGGHMEQPYSEVSMATAGTKAAGEKKKKHKGKKSKQNAGEMNNMYTDSDYTKGNLHLEDTISPYEDVDGTDKPKGTGPVNSQLPMYAEVDRSQKPKKAPELAEYADVGVVKKNKHARKAAKADIVEPEVVEYEEVDFKKKSPGAPAAAGGGVTLGAAALPEYGQVDFSKKPKQGKASEPPQLEEYAQVDFSKKNGKESEAAGKSKPPVKGKKPKPGAPPPRPPRAASVDEGERTQRPPDRQPQFGVEGTLYADLDLINTTPTRTEPTVHANLEPSEYASIDALRLTTRPADQ